MIQLLKVKSCLVVLLLISLSGCDFTPRMYKDILRAQELISESKYSEAIIQYESITKKNTSNKIKIKIYYQLGELYSIHIGNYQKASGYYNLIKKQSNDLFRMNKYTTIILIHKI